MCVCVCIYEYTDTPFKSTWEQFLILQNSIFKGLFTLGKHVAELERGSFFFSTVEGT